MSGLTDVDIATVIVALIGAAILFSLGAWALGLWTQAKEAILQRARDSDWLVVAIADARWIVIAECDPEARVEARAKATAYEGEHPMSAPRVIRRRTAREEGIVR